MVGVYILVNLRAREILFGLPAVFLDMIRKINQDKFCLDLAGIIQELLNSNQSLIRLVENNGASFRISIKVSK